MATDDNNRMTDGVDAQLNPKDFARELVAALDDDVRDWLNAQSPEHRRRIIDVAVRAGFNVAAGGSLDVDDLARLLTEQGPPLQRPAESAPKADWVDYVVALGADREHVDAGTAHYDPASDTGYPDAAASEGLTASEHPAYRKAGGFTKDELVELADRLGG